jgi:hypothetical protein
MVYARRRLLGHVPVAQDGSAHFVFPGGVPIVLHVSDPALGPLNLSGFQREEMQFSPGEYTHQGFPHTPQGGRVTGFFDGLCGTCHNAVSGRTTDATVQPDILTQASLVVARGSTPANLQIAPGQRDKNFVGPPKPF